MVEPLVGIRKRSAARAGPLLRERQREREGRAAVRSVLCQQPTTVSLDQGPGDRESHPEALRLRRVERLEDQRQLALGDPAATVAHRDAYDAVGADAGRDGEATIVAGPHRIEAIHDQVEDDLLELNAIGEDHGQSGRELEIDGHPPGGRVAPYQADHVLNAGIDVERSLVRVVLFEQGPQTVDHIDGSLVVGADVGVYLLVVLGYM